jgi:hypothetical protein
VVPRHGDIWYFFFSFFVALFFTSRNRDPRSGKDGTVVNRDERTHPSAEVVYGEQRKKIHGGSMAVQKNKNVSRFHM